MEAAHGGALEVDGNSFFGSLCITSHSL